ncbi:THUMP-like domain-containing protein [Aequorivita flava]|uniref:Class I SAM-dependent methyltransferase n=1 Tax=Aequorivita flava TaxID=3114371 RepID=A0AB35YLB3_9FLAO
MLNKNLLNKNVQNFIKNFDSDISKLAFAGSSFKNITVQELMQQIESRRKIAKKLPTWFKTDNILYPPKLNLEQTSSEITAKYKASLVGANTLADITGGFGVDSFYFSETCNTVHHFETNKALSSFAAHNFKILNKDNIICKAEDGLQAVLNSTYDVIYADPSRRHDSKGKVFFMKDCLPDIPSNISEILNHCNTFLLKTSPMLDISVGLNELHKVAEIHIVAIENEVKELLWLLNKDSSNTVAIKTINFTKSETENFNFIWNMPAEATYSLPLKYLFEPNAAILKSGAFNFISEKLQLNKLHQNTHLYTSNSLTDFPGRSFLIEKIVPYTKSDMRLALTFNKANITTRNFPQSVETLRKKWKITDGGDIYLFFVTNIEDRKEMLVCRKI